MATFCGRGFGKVRRCSFHVPEESYLLVFNEQLSATRKVCLLGRWAPVVTYRATDPHLLSFS